MVASPATTVGRLAEGVERAQLIVQMVRDPLGTVRGRFATFGDTYRSPTSRTPLIVTRDPETARDVLVTQVGIFSKEHPSFETLSQVVGNALLTSVGETWRRQRRLIQPAFSRARMEEYAQAMVDETLVTTRELSRGPAQNVNCSALLTSLTLRIVARTLFGYDVDESPRVGRAMRWLNERFARPDLLPEYVPTPRRIKMRLAKRDLDKVVAEIITQRRRRLARGETGVDLLQHLLTVQDDDGQGLSDTEIRDQLLTLYLAGHDTTTHALSWTLYELLQHPEVLAELRREVDTVLGGRTPTLDDLNELVWTEAAFKETMRLYPPAHVIPRIATEATTLAGLELPERGEVVIWVYHLQRNPRFFEHPDEFRPQRFLPEAEPPPKHAYIPFGLGQRACIGQQFAMIEAKLILAAFVQQLDFSYRGQGHPGIRSGVTLAPKNGVPLRIAARR